MDQNTIFKRVKRHIQTTSSFASLANQKFFEQMGFQGGKVSAEAMQLILGDLKGPMMKVGQILSTIPDMLPDEYVDAFQNLQNQAPPMGELFVKRRMRSELGLDWESNFSYFNLRPFAAASLGQTHAATDLKGILLACKLQYPDMESFVQADLKKIKFFFQLYKSYGAAIDTDNIFYEIEKHLTEETNYKKEAENLKIFRNILASCPFIHIPEIHEKLSTSRLISMSFLKGDPIQNFYESDQKTKNIIAKRLFYGWYYPFYKESILHGDPHLGNYTVSAEKGINIMDFGCVRFFSKDFVRGVVFLYKGILEKNDRKIKNAYELWGFNEQRKEVLETLNMWAQYLYGPLLENRVRKIDSNGLTGKSIAKEVHEKLRFLGGVNPPREFVFMDRVAVCLGSAFIRLQAELNWHKLFEELLEETSHTYFI